MEQGYLIDTNVIIDNFGSKLQKNAVNFISKIEISISVVTKIEVLGWKNATENQLKPLYNFMETIRILQINEAVIDKTIEIRQSKKINLGGALIAATALTNNLTIITRNTKDFENIKGLQVINPYNL
jgi:predicted nucleic acid-binding protein